MISVQKAIFPGIMFGCIFLVIITGIIAKPGSILAQSFPAPVQRNFAAESAQVQEAEIAPDQAVEEQAAVVAQLMLPVVENKPLEAAQNSPGEPPAVEEPVQTKPVEENPVVEEPPSAEAEVVQVEDCSLSSTYPDSIQRWCSFIQRAANEQGLDANLIAAVMLQESGGNPDAYSKSGAVGLMQVMPRDGIAAGFMCVNGPCFSNRPSIAELSDPEFNINYGVNMLAGLVRKYGDVREGLRAYGPMNMGYRYADIVLNILSQYQ